VHTGTEHLLLGITRVEGSPAELLRQHGIDVAQVRHALEYRISTISWNVVESVRA
jgi:Clp amino terminal domain, pathogenicity island component